MHWINAALIRHVAFFIATVIMTSVCTTSGGLEPDKTQNEPLPTGSATPMHATPANLGPDWTQSVVPTMLSATPTGATPIDLGIWYAFEWSGFVVLDGWLEASGSSYYTRLSLADPGDSPWTFTSPSTGVYFTVTDLETDVDSFAIIDNGVLIGTTPGTDLTDSHGPCYSDPEACMDSDFSHGTFFLGAGEHVITIENKDPRGVTGRGAFRLDTTPEYVDTNDE
jgi:hypothetical protein